MTTFEERHQTGTTIFEEVNGFPAPAPANTPLIEFTVDHVFGEIWTRPGLTRKERRLIALTAVAAAGATDALKVHVGSALRSNDLTPEELRELVLQFAVYQGYPKATTFHAVVEAAVRAGT